MVAKNINNVGKEVMEELITLDDTELEVKVCPIDEECESCS